MTTAANSEGIDPRDLTIAAEIRAEIARQRLKMSKIAIENFGRPPQWLSRRLLGEVPLTPAEMLTLGDILCVDVVKWLIAAKGGPGGSTERRHESIQLIPHTLTSITGEGRRTPERATLRVAS